MTLRKGARGTASRGSRLGRVVRTVAGATGLVLVLTLGVPPGQVGAPGHRDFPLSWLARAFAPGTGWALPGLPPTPHQDGGTAKGASHDASTADTSAHRGTGHARGTGAGELPAFTGPTRPARTGPSGHLSTDDSFNPATSTRIAAQSTETSDLFANADGSFTRRAYQQRHNYKALDGTWQPIDTTLVPGPGGRWRVGASSTAVDLAASADDPVLESVQLDAGHAVGYALLGAAAVGASVSGDTATYDTVFAGTDLTLQALTGGLKETFVLHSADAPNSWTFALHLRGLTARLAADGSVQYLDAAGTVRLSTPAAYMTDANYDPHSGEPAVSRAVRYDLVDLPGGGQGLRVTADALWLTDPARVFPVSVDPTTANEGPTGGTYAETTNPGDNHLAAELKTGTSDGASIHAYSFLKFDNFFTDFHATAHITAVSLKIFDFWAWTCSAQPFWVNPVSVGWTLTGVTGYPGPAFGAAIGSVTADPGVACTNTGHNVNLGTWMSVPLTKDTLVNWAAGGVNNGLAVTASQSVKQQWKQFASTNTAHAPYLAVTYDLNTAPVVDRQYPPVNYPVPTLTPELVATGHDPDAFPGTGTGPVNYRFRIYSYSGGTLTKINESLALSTGDHVVPAGVLTWGQTYYWQAVVNDGGLAGAGIAARVGVGAVAGALFVDHGDRGLVPRLPPSGLVPGDQEDRFACRIEREDQPDLGGPHRSGPQLFHVVVPAALAAVHQRSALGRAPLGEQVDRFTDQVCGGRAVSADFQEPCLGGGVETDFPYQRSMSPAYVRCRPGAVHR